VPKSQHRKTQCSECSSFFIKFKSNLLVKSAFFLLHDASAMTVLDLVSLFPFYGATAPSRTDLSHYRASRSHSDTPHLVGPL
jgi:hypothetical protein